MNKWIQVVLMERTTREIKKREKNNIFNKLSKSGILDRLRSIRSGLLDLLEDNKDNSS